MSKELYVFDFDDTLIRSNSKSKITDKQTGEIVQLSSEQFKLHKIDFNRFEYDLTEYDDLPSKFIINNEVLEDLILASKSNNAVILTARHLPNGPIHFLEQYDLYPKVKVVALGKHANISEGKANWIRNQFFINDYTHVHVWDDNEYNLQYIEKLKNEFDDVVFNLRLIRF